MPMLLFNSAVVVGDWILFLFRWSLKPLTEKDRKDVYRYLPSLGTKVGNGGRLSMSFLP